MHSWIVGLLVVIGTCACNRREEPQGTLAPPSAEPAPPASSASASGATKAMAQISFAAFVDDRILLQCTDWVGPEVAITRIAEKMQDVTKLKQSCDSLGQPAMASCLEDKGKLKLTTHYYQDSHSDRYMADCVKKGGTWSRNASPEADLQRAQQKLEKLEKGAQ